MYYRSAEASTIIAEAEPSVNTEGVEGEPSANVEDASAVNEKISFLHVEGESIEVISLCDELHKYHLLHYVKSTGFINVPSTYLVASAFRELKDRMSKEIDSGLLLVGPKGCGKSISLIALLVFLKSLKKGTVVYLSSWILKKLEIPTVKEYNEITFSKYCEYSEDKAAIIKSLTSVKNYETFLLHIITSHRKQNPHERLYILIDFCQFDYIEATILETMLNISVQSWGCVKVIAPVARAIHFLVSMRHTVKMWKAC